MSYLDRILLHENHEVRIQRLIAVLLLLAAALVVLAVISM